MAVHVNARLSAARSRASRTTATNATWGRSDKAIKLISSPGVNAYSQAAMEQQRLADEAAREDYAAKNLPL